MQAPLRQLRHRVRDSLRCHSARQLEARRPVTFGGLGDGADATELEKSLLRRLLAGAMWTAARVSGHGVRANAACHGDSLFPEQPHPRPRNPYPWDAFVGPIPGDAVRHQPRLQPGVPPDWRWPRDYIHDLVRWARALARDPGPAEVSWAEVALDYEAFVGRALPASPDHRVRGTRLPLGERAQVLRKAVGLAERHLAAGVLLSGAPLGRCRSLLPLGGGVCAGLSARP